MHIFQFGFDIRNTMTCAVLVLEMVTIQNLTPWKTILKLQIENLGISVCFPSTKECSRENRFTNKSNWPTRLVQLLPNTLQICPVSAFSYNIHTQSLLTGKCNQ